MAGFHTIIRRMYTQPTYRQILLIWPRDPAKIVALLIQDAADQKMGGPISQKAYDHTSQQDRDAYDKEQKHNAKVWFSVRELAKRANASREGIDKALDELQAAKCVESDRPKSGPKHRGNNSYWFRLGWPTEKKAIGSS